LETDWIILADAAEVVNNKLYLIGGGWEALTIDSGFPVQHPCAVAVSFKVPWNETNQQHNIEIEIADQDGKPLVAINGQVEVGRPPGIPLGQAQTVRMAVALALHLEHPGTYVIVSRIEGQESRRIQFYVVPGPLLKAQQLGA